MKKIKLSNCDEYAFVSECDFESVNAFNWCKRNDGYASTKINHKNTLMHRYIFLELMNNLIGKKHVVEPQNQ